MDLIAGQCAALHPTEGVDVDRQRDRGHDDTEDGGERIEAQREVGAEVARPDAAAEPGAHAIDDRPERLASDEIEDRRRAQHEGDRERRGREQPDRARRDLDAQQSDHRGMRQRREQRQERDPADQRSRESLVPIEAVHFAPAPVSRLTFEQSSFFGVDRSAPADAGEDECRRRRRPAGSRRSPHTGRARPPAPPATASACSSPTARASPATEVHAKPSPTASRRSSAARPGPARRPRRGRARRRRARRWSFHSFVIRRPLPRPAADRAPSGAPRRADSRAPPAAPPPRRRRGCRARRDRRLRDAVAGGAAGTSSPRRSASRPSSPSAAAKTTRARPRALAVRSERRGR